MRSCRAARLLAHGRGDAVGGEDDDRALRHLVGVVDEDRAALGEGLHHVHVVHDLLADVDGGAVLLERPLDGLDGPVDACAVAAGLGHQDSLGGHVFERTGTCPQRPGFGLERRYQVPARDWTNPGGPVRSRGRMDAMNPLPFPVRIAAGLVATAVEQARDLPRLVVEFPVTAVSQALQASMRVQQKVTELAIKGDRVLGTLRPVEEKPSWATFDEDEPPSRNGASAVTELRPLGRPVSRARGRPAAARAERRGRPRRCAHRRGRKPRRCRPRRRRRPSIPTSRRCWPGTPRCRSRSCGASCASSRSTTCAPCWRGSMAHGERPPFVTMLTNRITAVQEA